MIGVARRNAYGAWPSPSLAWLNPVQAGSDLSAAVLNWWNTPADSIPSIGPSNEGMTPTQVIQSSDVLSVPVRIERPVEPVQLQVPGASAGDYRQDPYQQHAIQSPGFVRSGWPSWAWWALGAGVFVTLLGGGVGITALVRKRRARGRSRR